MMKCLYLVLIVFLCTVTAKNIPHGSKSPELLKEPNNNKIVDIDEDELELLKQSNENAEEERENLEENPKTVETEIPTISEIIPEKQKKLFIEKKKEELEEIENLRSGKVKKLDKLQQKHRELTRDIRDLDTKKALIQQNLASRAVLDVAKNQGIINGIAANAMSSIKSQGLYREEIEEIDSMRSDKTKQLRELQQKRRKLTEEIQELDTKTTSIKQQILESESTMDIGKNYDVPIGIEKAADADSLFLKNKESNINEISDLAVISSRNSGDTTSFGAEVISLKQANNSKHVTKLLEPTSKPEIDARTDVESETLFNRDELHNVPLKPQIHSEFEAILDLELQPKEEIQIDDFWMSLLKFFFGSGEKFLVKKGGDAALGTKSLQSKPTLTTDPSDGVLTTLKLRRHTNDLIEQTISEPQNAGESTIRDLEASDAESLFKGVKDYLESIAVEYFSLEPQLNKTQFTNKPLIPRTNIPETEKVLLKTEDIVLSRQSEKVNLELGNIPDANADVKIYHEAPQRSADSFLSQPDDIIGTFIDPSSIISVKNEALKGIPGKQKTINPLDSMAETVVTATDSRAYSDIITTTDYQGNEITSESNLSDHFHTPEIKMLDVSFSAAESHVPYYISDDFAHKVPVEPGANVIEVVTQFVR